MPLAPIQPALKCGSSWMSIQSSMNPQSAKSSKSQPLWALENKWFNMWHAAEEFTLLTDLRKHHKRRLGSFAGASKVLYPILLGYTKVPYTKLLLVAYSASAMSYLQCELVLNDAFCIQSNRWTCQVTKLRRWHVSLGQTNPSHEKLSQCSSGGQLDVLVSAMAKVPRLQILQKERNISSGQARLKRKQDSLHMPESPTRHASCLNLDIPLYQCSYPKGMYEVSQ